MKKGYFVTFVLILCFFIFICWFDNMRVKEIEELDFKLNLAKDEIEQLKDENLELNYKLCLVNKDNSKICQKVKKDIEFKKELIQEIENIYNKNYK